MNKVILKTALYTVGLIIAAGLLVFSLWILISPQSMATACENTGNYSFAVTCADLRYKYTKDVADLARCTQDSISAKKDSLIVKYGEQLIADEGFDGLCAKMDAEISGTKYGEYAVSYKSYVCGNLAAAQYGTGSLDKALKTAERGGNFDVLVIRIIENNNKDDGREVLKVLNGADEGLVKLLENFINEGV